MPARTAEEIRASIEQNREGLGVSMEKLRGEVARLTDWRAPLRRHRGQAVLAAGIAGFVVGGGVAALSVLTIGRGRRSSRDGVRFDPRQLLGRS